jgi:hypothetical protein
MANEELKAALKEALREWLDDKFAQFGRYSITAIGAAAFSALVYFILRSDGWHK